MSGAPISPRGGPPVHGPARGGQPTRAPGYIQGVTSRQLEPDRSMVPAQIRQTLATLDGCIAARKFDDTIMRHSIYRNILTGNRQDAVTREGIFAYHDGLEWIWARVREQLR